MDDASASFKLYSIAAGDITGDFKPINTERLPSYTYCLRMVNNSDQPIIISYDGLTEHEYIRANRKISINSQANNVLANKKSFIQGSYASIIYVRWYKFQGPTGSVYLMGYNLN